MYNFLNVFTKILNKSHVFSVKIFVRIDKEYASSVKDECVRMKGWRKKMKTTKKVLCAVISAVTALTLFTGCSGRKTGNGSTVT